MSSTYNSLTVGQGQIYIAPSNSTAWQNVGWTTGTGGIQFSSQQKRKVSPHKYLIAMRVNGKGEHVKVSFKRAIHKDRTLYDVYLKDRYIGTVNRSNDRPGWYAVNHKHEQATGLISRKMAAVFILESLNYEWELQVA